MAIRRKKNYAMKRLDTPKRVTLPNGRVFTACYRCAKRSELPAHINFGRTYKNRAAVGRRRKKRIQQGARIASTLKKVVTHPLFKAAVKTGAEQLPSVYDFSTSKVTNKKLKNALQSDLAKQIVSGISKQGVKYGTVKPTIKPKPASLKPKPKIKPKPSPIPRPDVKDCLTLKLKNFL